MRTERALRIPRWIVAVAILASVIGIAFFIWTRPSEPAPRAPTSSDLAALDAATRQACREQALRLIGVGRQARWPEDPTLEAMRQMPLVAFDQRGAASAALFQRGMPP